MKKSKKLHYLLASIILTLGFVTISCKDLLNEPPHGTLNQKVLANKKGANTLLIGAYAALSGENVGEGGGPLHKASSSSNWIYGSVVGGDAHKGSSSTDQPPLSQIARGNPDPTNSYFDAKWKADYEGISRCNAVLKILPDVKDATDEEKVKIAAEAKFLRGHYYFDLKKIFNMVPWIDETTTDYKQPNEKDIWPNIEKDFQFAMENLPETQPEVGRTNKWAAEAYLAKAYIFQQKWQKAKQLYDDVIANGVTSNGLSYALIDNYANNFNAATQNNSETVFAVQYNVNDGTNGLNGRTGDVWNFPYNSPLLCCGFFQPSQDLVNSFRTDPNTGLPYLDSYNSSKVKSDQGISSNEHFTPYKGSLDPRLDWTVGRRGIPYNDFGPHPGKRWIRDQQYGGPYSPQKNIPWQYQGDKYVRRSNRTAINYAFIRFDDVLLIAAEAEVELGNLEKAREYVNRVRGRIADYPDSWVNNGLNKGFALAVVDNESDMLATDAKPGDWVVRTDRNSTFVLLKGSPVDISNWQEYTEPNYNIDEYPGPWADQSEAHKKVHFERKLELAMEGHRFFDLVRWNKADQKINAYYEYEGSLFPDVQGAHFTSNKNEYFPIPLRQIDLSVKNGEPVLQQNPGY